MNLQQFKLLYFIGIGGIGMSAIARYFHSRGVRIEGYDKTSTPLTKELEAQGMLIHYEENLSLLPATPDAVIYTPAIPANHLELVHYQKSPSVSVLKRSEILELITNHSKVIGVAGTHGKTTTSTIIAHVLKHTGFDCTAFLGGISTNYNTNFLIGVNDWMVVEADEYDRSFLKLFPQLAVITAVDADHLDIYAGGLEDFENTFVEFTNQVRFNGKIFLKIPLAAQPKINKAAAENTNHAAICTYSLQEEQADWHTKNIHYDNGIYDFEVWNKQEKKGNFKLGVHGLYNIENALAAIAIAYELAIETSKIIAAIAAFEGVKRRFEYILKTDKLIYIDDYAHHPNEIGPFLTSVRAIYPNRKVTVIFQPHLYSRTRDFAAGFSETLSNCEELILLPIYPARELPIPGISSEMLLENCTCPTKLVLPKEEVIQYLQKHTPDIICTIGAGDIDQIIQPLNQWLLTLINTQNAK
jgi:UDP-N-acetylmuramate--alanine ligase